MEYFAIDFETANDNNKIICVRMRNNHITHIRPQVVNTNSKKNTT